MDSKEYSKRMSITNFIQRANTEKELKLLTEILELSHERGTIQGETYKGLESYRDDLYSMLEDYDKEQLKSAHKKQ